METERVRECWTTTGTHLCCTDRSVLHRKEHACPQTCGAVSPKMWTAQRTDGIKFTCRIRCGRTLLNKFSHQSPSAVVCAETAWPGKWVGASDLGRLPKEMLDGWSLSLKPLGAPAFVLAEAVHQLERTQQTRRIAHVSLALTNDQPSGQAANHYFNE